MLRRGPAVSSSSSARAGSGENRLDRRGEADPVLVMPVLSLDDPPVSWSWWPSAAEAIPTKDSSRRREGGVDGSECPDSRRSEGSRDGLGSSFSRMPFRDTYKERCQDMW